MKKNGKKNGKKCKKKERQKESKKKGRKNGLCFTKSSIYFFLFSISSHLITYF